MILTLEQAMRALEDVANTKYDGHYTILKFTTGYKVIFGTLDMNDEDREYIQKRKGFKSLKDAISYAVMED